MLRRAIESFSPRRQPLMTRQSYSHELVNALTYPVAMALVEGGVIGVLAQKAFDVPPYLYATIMAAPMFANLTSFLWAYLAKGKPKVRFINALQVLTLVTIAAIALLPTEGPLGGVLLTLLIVAGRCLMSGIITLRSTVWRMNYPRHLRAQITGKLALLQSLLGAVAPLAGYALLDFDVQWFRVIYPASVLIAGLGVLNFSRIRLRREKELLAYEMTPAAAPTPRGEAGSLYEIHPTEGSEATSASFWSVLQRDKTFRRYMVWQFVSGASNMMGETVIIAAIANMTKGLPAEWFTAITLSTALPMLFAVATLPYWSRYLDRVHVADFRGVQAWWWIGNQALNWVAIWLFVTMELFWLGFVVMGIARVAQGVARAAGMLAWNLGHNDFADRRMVAVYMGIHVTLTGVRGAVAPFLAVLLYDGWPAIPALGIPEWGGMQYHVFLITTAMAIWGERGFSALARDLHASEGGGKRQD